MSAPGKIAINLAEEFPHLTRAPIVEAVIDIRARANTPWEQSSVSERLKRELPDYPKVVSQNDIRHEFQFVEGQPPQTRDQNLGWRGLQFQSADQKQIAQFNRDGFTFFRLNEYESWEKLSNESERLWRIYAELAQPMEAQRLGVRFINRIELAPGEARLEDCINPYPSPPSNLD